MKATRMTNFFFIFFLSFSTYRLLGTKKKKEKKKKRKLGKTMLLLTIGCVCACLCFSVRVAANNLQVLELHGLEGGTTDPKKRWRAECQEGYALIAFYDDDNGMADVDFVKCRNLGLSREGKTLLIDKKSGVYTCPLDMVMVSGWDDSPSFGSPKKSNVERLLPGI